jgi:hypothetical protein
MELPKVKTVVVFNEKKNIVFTLLGYRRLTYEEAAASVRAAVSGMKKKPQPNSRHTIVTTYGADE